MSPFIFKVPLPPPPPIILTYVEVGKLLASDGAAGDEFGRHKIKISGTTIVVGAFTADPGGVNNQGAAYVYEKSGSSWIQVQKLLASDGIANDNFGVSVDISGTTVVIGAYQADPGGVSGQGAAYVYEKSGTWPATETQKLLASDGIANDAFGVSVAIDGTTIVVGAFSADPGGVSGQGAAYVYEKSGTWVEVQKLIASDGLTLDQFGNSVDISGTTIVVGASEADPGGNSNQGAAYVFGKSGTWPATETQKLLSSDGLAEDKFGYSVAIDGTTVVIGAYQADPGGVISQGAVYVFEKSGTWPATETQKLLASDGAQVDWFGVSVDISGPTIAIGMQGGDPPGTAAGGEVYVFENDGSSWLQVQKLSASDALSNDKLGDAVGIDGTTIVAGAYGADPGGNVGQGAAYVFNKQ